MKNLVRGYRMEERKAPTHVGERFMRYMGAEEYYKLLAGETLVNDVRHCTHARSSSEGFCFLPMDGEDAYAWSDAEETMLYVPEVAAHFISGIVGEFALVEFVNASEHMTEGFGVYADPYGGWDDRIGVTEYSTTEYDRDSMRPVAVTFYPFDIRDAVRMPL